jgi:hypothetical protein
MNTSFINFLNKMKYLFQALYSLVLRFKLSQLSICLFIGTIPLQAQTNINGTFSVVGNVGIFGDLTIGSTAHVYFQDGSTLNMMGASTAIHSSALIYANTSSTQAGTGKMVFIGSAAQTLDGGNSSTIGGDQPSLINVVVNNTNNLTLTNTNTRITSGLDFINGHILLGNNNLELSSSATATNANETKHVVTNGTGFLAKEAFTSAFTFPVGRATSDFTPATVTPAASDDFFVQVKNYSESASDEFVTTEAVDRTWTIYSTAGAGATIALQHNDATNGTGTLAFNPSDAFVTQYQGIQWVSGAQRNQGVWQVGTGANASSSTGSVSGSTIRSRVYSATTTSSVSNGAFFSKSSNIQTPLPITLLDFTAIKQNEKQSLLSWITTSEINSSHFEIETSTNGEIWNKIGELQAQGASLQSAEYQFIHQKPALGINYYRLIMTDRDGSAETSPIRMLEFGRTNSVNTSLVVCPNPTSGSLMIHNTSYSSQYVLSDMHGKPIALFNNIEKNKELTFDLSSYSNGIYFLKEIPANGDPIITKIVLNK